MADVIIPGECEQVNPRGGLPLGKGRCNYKELDFEH